MTTTGFWPVKGSLKAVFDYVEKPDKITGPKYLDEDFHRTLTYVENDSKTDQKLYVSTINCRKQDPYGAMMATKRRVGKLDRNITYHGFRSSKPAGYLKTMYPIITASGKSPTPSVPSEGEHIVIENQHQSIIDCPTFATSRALREKRTTSHYRGVKKKDNVYSGFLACGDCGASMFAMSCRNLAPAYTCGTYHRRGRAGCTCQHIRGTSWTSC